MNELRRSICEIISKELNIAPALLEKNVNLREIGSVDSINLVRVIARIEDQFDVELDDDVVFKVTTVDDLVNAVSALKENGSRAR